MNREEALVSDLYETQASNKGTCAETPTGDLQSRIERAVRTAAVAAAAATVQAARRVADLVAGHTRPLFFPNVTLPDSPSPTKFTSLDDAVS